MIDILNKYLILFKSLNIPGVGSLFIETLPAATDFVNKQIAPPRYTYRFDKYFDSPDKDFFNYLASCKNIPDYEAMKLYNQFAEDMRTTIKLEGQVLWKNVGHFSRNDSGEIAFEPLNGMRPLYEPVNAERVIRNNASHTVLVGDQEKTSVQMSEFLQEDKKARLFIDNKNWRLAALILAAVALVILAIHFSINGFSWQAMANQQPVKMVQPTRP
ncbi:MAG: hypothetical protein WKF89_07235 [Chitinophagaceae bacterium]